MNQARTLGDRVREARRRRGLTQRDLARLSGLSLSLVRKLEQDERGDIRIETAHKLAASLGVRTTTLIGDRHLPALSPASRRSPGSAPAVSLAGQSNQGCPPVRPELFTNTLLLNGRARRCRRTRL